MSFLAQIRSLSVLVLLLSWASPAFAVETTNKSNQATLIVVVGAPGEEEFGEAFSNWAARWRAAGEKGGAHTIMIGPWHTETNSPSLITTNISASTNAPADYDLLKQTFDREPKEGLGELWVVLIGHGTYDGRQAKFNLRGPDFSSTNLAEWLKPFKRPVAVVDCSSASGPFLKALSAPGRAVITSTKSGGEQNYSRFGRYLSESLSDPLADLDKDGQTSLLELFLSASAKVAEFYKTEGRLATEHALLDDNGDGLGTPPDWFRGIRAVKKSTSGAVPDGLRAHQFHLLRSEEEQNMTPESRAHRDELERQVEALRDQKASYTEDQYYQDLEKIMLELARLYEQSEVKK